MLIRGSNTASNTELTDSSSNSFNMRAIKFDFESWQMSRVCPIHLLTHILFIVFLLWLLWQNTWQSYLREGGFILANGLRGQPIMPAGACGIDYRRVFRLEGGWLPVTLKAHSLVITFSSENPPPTSSTAFQNGVIWWGSGVQTHEPCG